MEKLAHLPIREIVAKDYRAALVFRAFGIDFCCKGDLTPLEACTRKKINPEELLTTLIDAFTSPREEQFDFASWPLPLLANYVETKHHKMIRDRIPMIQNFLKRVVKVHGNHEPYLRKVKQLFDKATQDLAEHLKREELIIFPYIKKISGDQNRKRLLLGPAFEPIREAIHKLMEEHEQEGNYLNEIRTLTHNFTPPEYACNTYKVAFSLLEEFDMTMQKHMHLEHNILFPAALSIGLDQDFN
jgi:regulator of cell morphogenesis and NO signaling